MAKTLMFMGTGSDVGKSLLVAGLCRAFVNRGLKVAPFKPQNMSNNAAVTADGGEIGRAQALQARAARLAPVTAMNPVLLKPEQETGSQVILRGKRVASMSARDYFKTRQQYLPACVKAFAELCAENDLVLIEGAGSASEINLRDTDIANFGFAEAVKSPVVVIGDIHRGGVIASLVGTLEVVAKEDAALIAATLINKFHGDPSLFDAGKSYLEQKTGRPCLGPVPHFADAVRLPAEDALALDQVSKAGDGVFHVVVPRLPRIANFDDLDPLRAEPDVKLTMVQPGNALPRDADLIILPGSKATRADLDALINEGWDIDIKAHVRAGGAVLGICGGYQMLGHEIADPEGIEGTPGTSTGLGLLAVSTLLEEKKQLRVENAVEVESGAPISGYHMHMGTTTGADSVRPFARTENGADGARSANGRVMGTYMHGLFAADQFRRDFLSRHGAITKADLDYETSIDQVLDDLAAHLEQHLDLDALLALAHQPRLEACE